MQNSVNYVHTQVNTKSLLGRPALIGILQESKKGSPTRSNSPHDTAIDLQQQKVPQGGKEQQFSFNNNIYNNFAPDHSIDSVSPAVRLLPKLDQQKIEVIKRLKRTGKITSTGRSPVPLQLYQEAQPQDHLYVTKVTKLVPVAHDQQLQSESSPRDTLGTGHVVDMMNSRESRHGSDPLMSPQIAAHHELQHMLNQGYQITDNRISKAEVQEAFHRSLDAFNKSSKQTARVPGDVNLTLPPGFGLKSPKGLAVNSGSLMQPSGGPHLLNVATDVTDIQHKTSNMTTKEGAPFVSGATIPNQGMDSLFQEPSQEQSFDIAYTSRDLPQQTQPHFATIPSRDDFYASQGFRSVVRKTTHQEISEMLRAANPEVYADQRRQNAERRRRELSHPSRTLQDRKESFAAALRHNKWHAPVKKNQIFQKILDSSLEPRDREVDLAVVAHETIKYGAERDTTFEETMANHRVKSLGPGAQRKKNIQKMIELHRKNQLEKVQQEAQRAIEKSSNYEEVMSQKRSQETLEVSDTNQDVVSPMVQGMSQKLSGSLAQVVSPAMTEDNVIRDKSQLLQNRADGNKSPNVGKLYEQEQEQTRTVQEMTQGQTSSDGREGLALPNIIRATSDPRDESRSPMSRKTSQSPTLVKPKEKIKPSVLARRKAKKAFSQRKNSLAHLGINQNSSMPSLKSKDGNTPGQTSYEFGEETPLDAVDKIQELFEKLQNIEKRQRGDPVDLKTLPLNEASQRDLQMANSTQVASQSIVNLPVGGTFGLTESQVKSLEPAKHSTHKIFKKMTLKPKKNLDIHLTSYAVKQDTSVSPPKTPGKRTRNKKGLQSMTETKKEPEAPLFTSDDLAQLYAPDQNENLLPTSLQLTSFPQNTDQAKAQAEKEELDATVDQNNDIIRQILKDTARMLQRPDSEARFLRANVIHPDKLGKYSLRRFVGKTVQLNVGQLYQPLTFTFQDFSGNLKVFLSTRHRLPSEENGYEQRAFDKFNKVIFPLAQEHLSPNMLRYPKNKILYITVESDADCTVTVKMTHNKKEAPDMTVASVYSSQGELGLQQQSSFGPMYTEEGEAIIDEEELSEKAQATIDTLQLMLGGEQKTMHVAKLNAMVKKKINYMINEDLDVAKDFLELIEILKEHKIVVNRKEKENRLKQEQAHRQAMQVASKDPTKGDVLVQNQIEMAQKNLNAIGNQVLQLFDGFQHMFENDLFRLYREGQLSMAQLNEMRAAQSKNKRNEIQEMARIRSLQAVTKKERRKDLQERIVSQLQKQAADREFVSKWYRAILVHKAATKIRADMVKKKEEAHFLASIFWTVLKIKIRMGSKIRRNGPTPEERTRRQIKNSMISLGSSVHLRDYTGQKMIYRVLEGLRMRQEIKQDIIDTGLWVRRIQERFRSYWQVRTQQIDFLCRMIMREKERLQVAMIKESDKELRQVGWYAGKLSEKNILRVATNYYQACQYTYEPTFFAWRNKIQEFKQQGLEDMTDGWHNPFMSPRGVKCMAEVNYKVSYKSKSVEAYLQEASKNCRRRYRYYMNVDEDESAYTSNTSQVRDSFDKTSKNSEAVARRMAALKKKNPQAAETRSRDKLRKKNPEYACLEEAINKQEELFQAKMITDLKNCAYFPQRPAMKYFPTPSMTHQLIHQCITLQFKNFDAPESYKLQHDASGTLPDQQSPKLNITQRVSTREELEKSGLTKSLQNSLQTGDIEKAGRLGMKQLSPDFTNTNPEFGQVLDPHMRLDVNSANDGDKVLRSPSRLPSRQNLHRLDDAIERAATEESHRGNSAQGLHLQDQQSEVPGGPRIAAGPDSVQMASPQSLFSQKSRGKQIMIAQVNVDQEDEEEKKEE